MSVIPVGDTVRPSALGTSLPFLTAGAVYLVLLTAGNALLNDPDSYWHLVVGQWIVDHDTVPRADPFSLTFERAPWIAKEWLSQVIYAAAYGLAGWPGVTLLAAASMAAAFGLMAGFLARHLAPVPVLVLVCAAFVLFAPHALARPHALALPVMVAWVGCLLSAADRRVAPSFWLLLLMPLWANLHGGFTLGLLLAGAIGLDAVVRAPDGQRSATLRHWATFGGAAAAVACLTPYGPESMLVTYRLRSRGAALAAVAEWQSKDYRRLRPIEVCLMAGLGFALMRGVRMPVVRVLILLGLLHLGLSSIRNGDILGLLAPLVIAAPLARQFPEFAAVEGSRLSRQPGLAHVAAVVALLSVSLGFAWLQDWAPDRRISPVAAVDAIEAAGATPVFNDYSFGGYLIYRGVPPFMDGRNEVHGGAFILRHYRAVMLADVSDFLPFLDEYGVQSTLLAPHTPAVAYLDELAGWERLYADDVAVVHLRVDR